MRTSTTVHLGADTRVEAPEWADAYLDIGSGEADLNLFLGYDDEVRVTNIDKLAEALLEIRTRCMVRMAKAPEQADPITAAKGATERETFTDAG